MAAVLEAEPAVEPGEIVAVRLPRVDDDQSTLGEMDSDRLHDGSLSLPAPEGEERIEPDDRQPERARLGQAEADEVGLDEPDAGPCLQPGGGGPPAGPVEHCRIAIDGRYLVTRGGQRHGDPSRAGTHLEDRPAGPRGEGEVEVQVARVVREVEVVQAREGGGLDRGPLAASARAADLSPAGGRAGRPPSSRRVPQSPRGPRGWRPSRLSRRGRTGGSPRPRPCRPARQPRRPVGSRGGPRG